MFRKRFAEELGSYRAWVWRSLVILGKRKTGDEGWQMAEEYWPEVMRKMVTRGRRRNIA